jgi:hypothetical protein
MTTSAPPVGPITLHPSVPVRWWRGNCIPGRIVNAVSVKGNGGRNDYKH